MNSMKRWMLAFDASCATCREISGAVERACGQRVEVVPLARPDVTRWRQEVFGGEPPWAPTLIAVGNVGVRAWTGPRMAIPLVRRLGARATVRVLGALGQLRREGSVTGKTTGVSRARFLRLGAGAVVAAGALLAGRTPASAQATGFEEARSWVAANAGSLPRTYDQVIAFPMTYRKAIFEASTAKVRSQLWVAHFTRYRAAHGTTLSSVQAKIVDRARAIAADESTFARDGASDAKVRPLLGQLQEDAVREFGRDEAWALLASLGPAVTPGTIQPAACDVCECATASDWCSKPARYCRAISCPAGCDQPHGCACFKLCGTLWDYECDGYCEIVS